MKLIKSILGKNNELNGGLKNSKTTYNFLKQEFDEYKSKASKTLAAKDKLIATLKESATFSSSGTATTGENGELETSADDGEATTTTTTTTLVGSSAFNLKSIEMDELKMERDALKEELNSKNVTIEMLRADMMVICRFFVCLFCLCLFFIF